VLESIPRLQQLRYKICPSKISEQVGVEEKRRVREREKERKRDREKERPECLNLLSCLLKYMSS